MKRLISLTMILLVVLTITGCSGKYKEGSYEKVDKKVREYYSEGDFKSASELMKSNPWYTVQNQQLAQEILSTLEESVQNYNGWWEVIDRIDGSLSPEIQKQKDRIYNYMGKDYVRSGTEYLDKYWGKCSEGSEGNLYYQAVQKMNEHQALEAGKILYDLLDEPKFREKFEWYFEDYYKKLEFENVQDYFETMYCGACIARIHPAKTFDQIKLPDSAYCPNKYLHMKDGHCYSYYEDHIMDESLRTQLPAALANANGQKVLILSRIDMCGKDTTSLVIDSYMMRSIPQEYCAENLEEVGYILLLEYGYLENTIWYAGTATARLFEVKTGKEIFTSETLESDFPTSYFGEYTDVIFGSYPDITAIVKEALSSIK